MAESIWQTKLGFFLAIILVGLGSCSQPQPTVLVQRSQSEVDGAAAGQKQADHDRNTGDAATASGNDGPTGRVITEEQATEQAVATRTAELAEAKDLAAQQAQQAAEARSQAQAAHNNLAGLKENLDNLANQIAAGRTRLGEQDAAIAAKQAEIAAWQDKLAAAVAVADQEETNRIGAALAKAQQEAAALVVSRDAAAEELDRLVGQHVALTEAIAGAEASLAAAEELARQAEAAAMVARQRELEAALARRAAVVEAMMKAPVTPYVFASKDDDVRECEGGGIVVGIVMDLKSDNTDLQIWGILCSRLGLGLTWDPETARGLDSLANSGEAVFTDYQNGRFAYKIQKDTAGDRKLAQLWEADQPAMLPISAAAVVEKAVGVNAGEVRCDPGYVLVGIKMGETDVTRASDDYVDTIYCGQIDSDAIP